MPHLVETYALNCGLKIDRPHILQKFFPLTSEKFITLHPNSKFGSKCYDYWDEVVSIIAMPLKENGIDIIQIGTKEDTPIRGCFHTQGKCDINQTAYIISKSVLHLGADSFPTHVASGYDKKIVCLYSNTYSQIAKPYWTKKEDMVLLEPDRSETKPSFAADESPKTINEINPEDVAKSVLDLLGIKYDIKFKTIKKGMHYNAPIVQLVPDCLVNVSNLGIDSIIVRMDLKHNEKVLAEQLKVCNCSIVSDQQVNLDLLKAFKPKIKEFVYFVKKETHNPEFIKELTKIGFPVILMSEMDDEDIDSVKLYYMDYGLIQKADRSSDEEIEKIKSLDLNNLHYKAKRLIISEGKYYHSEAAWHHKQPSPSIAPVENPVIDDEDFWDCLDEFLILEKVS
jgi:hypothetical protein